jgi:hypothetical protein
MKKTKKIKWYKWLEEMFKDEGELVPVERAKELASRAYDRGQGDGAYAVRSGMDR